jgi:hypothetical protein
MEAVAQVLLGLLPDVGFEAAAQNPTCDEKASERTQHYNASSDEPLLASRHAIPYKGT